MSGSSFEQIFCELSEVKTPRFHKIGGPIHKSVKQRGSGSLDSYRDFVVCFGEVFLYRTSYEGYRIRIFARPLAATLPDGKSACKIGFSDGSYAYLISDASDNLTAIYEVVHGKLIKTAHSFVEWLANEHEAARDSYSKSKWEYILRGPRPFDKRELELVEARRNIRWEVVGIDSESNLVCEVFNASTVALRALTLGVRSKDRRLNGDVRLDLKSIGPGKQGRLHVKCYKGLVSPIELELFDFPDPRPEDRDYFVELELDPDEISGLVKEEERGSKRGKPRR